tara:strand:- start:1565 stop:3313 length:1749 start_codon:yes stop_codon:yes gene_type:complete
MEGGSLFNSGFLGASFLWWIGQVADDSVWRDNHLSGKFEGKDTVPGWGRRYKVRIIGLHDKEEETIPSDQLPWAQVMYPVTAGGGQTNAKQTPNIRQGNFVFGFFLDGQDQQVPVIMGILGNNDQTVLKTKTGTTDSNFGPTSGYSSGSVTKESAAREKVPDEDLTTEKPKSENQSNECSPAPPGVATNKFGLRPDKILTNEQFADSRSARAESERLGLTGQEKEDFVQQKVADGIKNRCSQANSPSAPSSPGASMESVGNPHRLSAADVKRDEKYQEKIVLMKPDDIVGSSIKAIQTALDNLLTKIDKYMNAISSYIDAVSLASGMLDLKKLIHLVSCEIAKYMKIIFDKVMEYALKLLNKGLTKAVAALPSSMRFQFSDIKEQLCELILCLYNKLTQNLCSLIESMLLDAIKPDDIEKQARDRLSNPNQKNTSTPNVPMCYAETLVGDVLASKRTEIDNANNSLLENVNAFIDDAQNQMAGVSNALGDINGMIGDIGGSMAAALQFQNITMNIFGCEISATPAVSDFYTFGGGGAGQPDSQSPSSKSVSDAAVNSTNTVTAGSNEKPYAEPPADLPDLDL